MKCCSILHTLALAHTADTAHLVSTQFPVSCVIWSLFSVSYRIFYFKVPSRIVPFTKYWKPSQRSTSRCWEAWPEAAESGVCTVQPTVQVSGCRPTAWLCMTADHPAWPPLEEQIGVLFGGECSLFGCLDIYPGWGHCGHWTLARGCGQSLSRSELWFWWPAQIILSWDSPMDLLWLVLLCVKSLSQANHYDGH